ncbi:MAG: pseudouridine-5'-phosphate glycosidase [Candidatus Cloacimonetes bacterium]|nr:pseudouridine-5'-phosphate glycosidase [Candidatus Cloacimonadota bacterium]
MKYVTVDPELVSVLQDGKPVIALETTLITHGMPYPDNLLLALENKASAESRGVYPAFIGILAGKLKVGLQDSELEYFATAENIAKVSAQNLSYQLSSREAGATTVSATMIAARLCGIEVIATGGIGGVHLDVNNSFDISPDLDELARTPVIVVSAGAKAILDLARTLEYLETRGIPVLGFRTDRFPAFYSAATELFITRVEEPQQIADAFLINKSLDMNRGMLVANPIPVTDEIPFPEIREYSEKALYEAAALSVKGRELTPFLLGKIVEMTDGRALQANKVLLKNNVELACTIAKELSRYEYQKV